VRVVDSVRSEGTEATDRRAGAPFAPVLDGAAETRQVWDTRTAYADMGRSAVEISREDADGLTAVLTAHRSQLIRFFTSRTGSAAEAEDVVQDIWLHVSRADTGPVAHPLAYLHRVGMNIVLDRIRERQRRQRREQGWSDIAIDSRGGEATDDSPSPHDIVDGRQQAKQLAAAIAALPAGAQRVFRRHKLDGLSHAEVAAEFGITRSAVEKHIAVALRHLREAIER